MGERCGWISFSGRSKMTQATATKGVKKTENVTFADIGPRELGFLDSDMFQLS